MPQKLILKFHRIQGELEGAKMVSVAIPPPSCSILWNKTSAPSQAWCLSYSHDSHSSLPSSTPPPDESPKVPLAFFANGKWDGFWQAARQQYQEVVRLPSLSTLAIHWVEERGRKEATKCYFWCYWMLWHCHLKMMADTDITQCWKMFWCHYHDLEHLSVGEKMTGQDNETEVQENSHWL